MKRQTTNNDRPWAYKLPNIPRERIFIGLDGLQYYYTSASKNRVARYWSAEMVDTLISLYPDNENRWLAEELKVNYNTLTAVAKSLNLHKSKGYKHLLAQKNGQITALHTKGRNRGCFKKGVKNCSSLIKKGEILFYQPMQRLDTREYFKTQRELARSIGCTPDAIRRAKKRGNCTVRGIKFAYISRRFYDKYINPKTNESQNSASKTG